MESTLHMFARASCPRSPTCVRLWQRQRHKTYSGAIADYEQAISRDQIKNSVSQASNQAGIKARTSDLKFKGTEMHQDFLAAILAQTDKLSFLKHCRELKVVDQFYSDFEVLDPDALALPHLWPLYDLLAEVFLTLSRPSSDHGANHFARFFEPPDPHKSLADYQSHIKPAVDYLQALQITDAAVLRDHLEAVSIINFITTCAHCKTSPKDISSAYLDVKRKIEAEPARDTTPITMQRFLPADRGPNLKLVTFEHFGGGRRLAVTVTS